MVDNDIASILKEIEAIARDKTIIGVRLNEVHLPTIPTFYFLKLSRQILNPIIQFAANILNSDLLSLELNSANPGPIYTLKTDKVIGNNVASLAFNIAIRVLYQYVATINASYFDFPNIRKAATKTISSNSKILIPWFGNQFALGDTVIAAAAFNELAKVHQSITIITDSGFDGMKSEILSRIIDEKRLNSGKSKIILVENEDHTDNNTIAIDQEIFKRYLPGHDAIIVPSNYGSKTSELLYGLEAALCTHSSIKTFIGFFDWYAVNRIAETSISKEIVNNNANLVLAYLQTQLTLRLRADDLTRNGQYLIPKFRINPIEIEQSTLFLKQKGYDSNNHNHCLFIIGDASSHPFKRLDFEKTSRLIEQVIHEANQLGREAVFAFVDPGSNINSKTVHLLKSQVRERIVYLAETESKLIASYLIMAQPRCTFIGLDSYNSHAFGAITNELIDQNTPLDRRQVILLGYWGDLAKSTWLPSSQIPVEIIDARDIHQNRFARVHELPIGELDRFGNWRVSLLGSD